MGFPSFSPVPSSATPVFLDDSTSLPCPPAHIPIIPTNSTPGPSNLLQANVTGHHPLPGARVSRPRRASPSQRAAPSAAPGRGAPTSSRAQPPLPSSRPAPDAVLPRPETAPDQEGAWCARRDARQQDSLSGLCMDFAARATHVLVSVPSRSSRAARAHPLDVDQLPLRLPPLWRRPGRTRLPPWLPLPPAPPRLLCPSPTNTRHRLFTRCHFPSALDPPTHRLDLESFSFPDLIPFFFLPAPVSPSSISNL